MKNSEREYEDLQVVDSTWMTVPKFRDELKKRFKTEDGKEISIHYAHYVIEQGALSHKMGGNKLLLGKFQGKTFVKISTEVRKRFRSAKNTGRPTLATDKRIGNATRERKNLM